MNDGELFLSGTLPDLTTWRIVPGCGCTMPAHRCVGGQHTNGPNAPWVVMRSPPGRNPDPPSVMFRSRLRSTLRVSRAIREAGTLAEAVFLIEADRMEVE